MLGSVTSDCFESSVVPAQRNVEPDDTLASLDEVKVLLRNASLAGGFRIEELDLLKETGLTVLVNARTKLS